MVLLYNSYVYPLVVLFSIPLAMVAGMLPIALAQGAGAEWKNGLAWVLIGGLLSSMFLTLVIVPLVYYLLDRGMMRLGKNGKKDIEIKD
jgi:HAE1 family hydrophobic/amphiphilic exporter-1